MLRAERLQTVNPNIQAKTPIDKWFEKLGGTCFTNAYTPAPDTCRSIACFQTGLMPDKNGCRKIAQFAANYLETEHHIFKTLYQEGFKIHALVTPFCIPRGEYAKDFLDYVTPYYDFRTAIKAIQQCDAEKQAVYMILDDYHDAVDLCPTLWADKVAQQHLSNAFEILFNEIPVSYFDHILIFSDHGCTLEDIDSQLKIDMINDNRTKIVLFMHKKGDTLLTKNHNIVSILDIYPTTLDWLGRPYKHLDGISLLKNELARNIVIEDNVYMPDIWNHLLTVYGIWGVRNKDYFFVQAVDENYRLDLSRHYRLQKIVDNEYRTILNPDEQILSDLRQEIEKQACYYKEHQKILAQIERNHKMKFIAPLPTTSYLSNGKAIAYVDAQKYERNFNTMRYAIYAYLRRIILSNCLLKTIFIPLKNSVNFFVKMTRSFKK